MAVFQGAAIDDPALAKDLTAGAACRDGLFAADIIVIGAPMDNVTGPTQWKARIDRVLVAGKTFEHGENGTPEGMVKGKEVFITSAPGGVDPLGSPAGSLEHSRTCSGTPASFEVTAVTIVRAEGVAAGRTSRRPRSAGRIGRSRHWRPEGDRGPSDRHRRGKPAVLWAEAGAIPSSIPRANASAVCRSRSIVG